MMELNLRKEQFSLAYVRAVASVAGFTFWQPSTDDDSIDFELSGRSVHGRPVRPKIEFQIKCTSTEILRSDQLIYPLKLKNYNDLRSVDVLVPRLLLVVIVPDSEAEWLEHSEEQLVIRRCGYWVSLSGMEETTNSRTVSISIPRSQLFDVAGLRYLMTKAAHKESL